MMSFDDYIKIRGLDSNRTGNENPAMYEIFQGLNGQESTTDEDVSILPVPITPISTNPAISEALWAGQNKLITAESVYAGQLEKLFKQQQQQMPAEETFLAEVLNELYEPVEEFVSSFLSGALITSTGLTMTPLARPAFLFFKFLIECGITLGWNKLKSLFQRGLDLCQGIIEENSALLQLEPSRENYELRKDALRIHTEMLENVIAQINTMENMLDQNLMKGTDTKSIVKALKPVNNLDELKGINEDTNYLKDLKDAIETIQEEHEKLRKGVEDLTFVDANLKYADNTSLHLGGKVLRHG